MKLKSFVFFVSVILFVFYQYFPRTVNRAAIDVGSGSIKVTVAQVDPRFQTIYQTFYSEEHPIPFKRDIQVGGRSQLSDRVQTLAIDTLTQIKKDLEIHQPVGWKGVATAASRQAKNAPQMFEKIKQILGMDISIISQEDEGRLGFATAVAVSQTDPKRLIAVDSGSGSFQLTTLMEENIEVIEGELGYIPSLEMLMDIRCKPLDLNSLPDPVTLEEAELLVAKMQEKMPPVSEEFLRKIQDPSSAVVGIGNENFIFSMGATGVGKKTFTKEELWDAIVRLAGRPASEMTQFSKPNTAVLGMVLLYSIMDSMQLPKLTACPANGVCEGILVDSVFWDSPAETPVG